MFNKINKNKKNYLLTLIALFFLLTLFGCQSSQQKDSFLFQNNSANNILNNNLVDNTQGQKAPRLLDGVLIDQVAKQNIPVAVMEENMPGVIHSTIATASIIYEMPVEGGFTRFMAIFDLNDLPENVGPVRSVRPYFADIADEYQPILIHAGGSAEVLFKLKQGFYKVFNLDDVSGNSRYFFRSESASMPHNLFIKKDQILKFLTDSKIDQSAKFYPWQFQEINQSSGEIKNIKITFSPIYDVSFVYNSDSKTYNYYQDENLYRDKNYQEVSFNNVVIQMAPIQIIDSVGRRKIDLSKEGKAEIFQNGNAIIGKWIKESGRTRFYDQNGNEIILNAGKTWIGVVADKSAINY